MNKHLFKIASDLKSIASDLRSLTDGTLSKIANRVPKKGDYVQKRTTLRGYDFRETSVDIYEVDRVEGQIVHLIDENGKPGQISTRNIGPDKEWDFYDPKYDVQKIESAYSLLEATAKSLKPDLTKMLRLSAKVLGLPSSSVSEQWKSGGSKKFGEQYEQRYMVWEGEIRVKKSATITLTIALSTDIYSDRDPIVAQSEVSALAPREVISFLTSVWSKFYLSSIVDAIAKFPTRLAEEKDRLGLLSNADFVARLSKAFMGLIKDSEKALKGMARLAYKGTPWQTVGPGGGSISVELQTPTQTDSGIQWKMKRIYDDATLKTVQNFASRASAKYGFHVKVNEFGLLVIDVPKGWSLS